MILVVLAAVVGYVLFHRSATTPAPVPAVVRPPNVAATGASIRLPEVAHDDDPLGAVRLEGQVIDEHEQPVAHAQVGIDCNPPRTVESDESGSFVIEHLIARAYTLEASAAKGYAGPVHIRLGAKPEPLTLRLQPGGSVEVTVTDGLAPIANALVELRSTVTFHATTDAKGIAVLAHVGATWAPLVANAPGFSPAAMMLGTSGDSVAHAALVLHRGVAVSGRVIDEAGKPVAGARIVATNASEPFPLVDPRRDGIDSKSDGTFELPAISAGTWRFTATHAGSSPSTSAPIILDGVHPRANIELVLASGATITGAVVDSTGAPVPGANVRVVVRGHVFWRAQRQAFTAADGTFAITGLPRRAVDIVAEHATGASKIAPLDLEANATQKLVITLAITGTIAGTVVDGAGAPIGDAQVTAEPDPARSPAELMAEVVRGPQVAVSDQAGAFTLAGIPDGTYRLRASRPGASETEQELAALVTATPGEHAVKLVVHERGTLTGKVAFASGGHPVAFTVRLGSTVGSSFATPDGSFSLGAAAGTHSLVIDGVSFVSARAREVTITEGKPTDLGTITVEAGRSISGRVLDERGSPVAGARVAAGALLTGGGGELYIADESIGAKDGTSDADGRFEIDGFAPGPLTIIAGKDKVGRSASLQLPPSGDSATLDLVLQPTTGVDGKIMRDGKPAADTVVILTPFGAAASNFFVVTGEDGTFALDTLSPGAYLVYPLIGGGGNRPKDMYIARLDIALAKRAHIEIDASAGPATLTVTATSGGKPLAAGQVFLVGATIAPRTVAELRALDQLGIFGAIPIPVHVRTLSEGTIAIEGVRLGGYTVCAGAANGRLDDGSKTPITCQAVTVAASQAVALALP